MQAIKSMKMEDQQLRELVLRELEWEPQVISNKIGVAVHSHVVTLSGIAHNYMEKLAAERVAKRVIGVMEVLNQVEVRPAAATVDAELAQEAVQALQRSASVPHTRIEVSVTDGEILLEGTVDWHFQSEAAEAAVQDLAGVTSVLNGIVVRAGVPGRDVRSMIEEALRRHAGVDPRRVVVATHNGTVELRGHVHSWAEKEEAASVAWAAPGVTKVENNIAVVP